MTTLNLGYQLFWCILESFRNNIRIGFLSQRAVGGKYFIMNNLVRPSVTRTR